MFLYAIGSLPLISSLNQPNDWVQVWYADDASICGHLEALKEWLSLVKVKGPSFGYFPEPSKSFLVVDEKFISEAENVFGGSGVNVVCSRRLLGGVIGNEAGRNAYVEELVKQWKSDLECLSMIAGTEPQAAFSAFTKSLQFQWSFLQRVVPDCPSQFVELEAIIAQKFLPAVFGYEISPAERELFSLPARMGGMGVTNPTEMSEMTYSASRNAADVIIAAIKGNSEFEIEAHICQLQEVRESTMEAKQHLFHQKFNCVFDQFDPALQRAVLRAKHGNTSAWLTVLPLQKSHFDLSAREFRDALAIRYRKPLLNVPAWCDGCGSPFDLYMHYLAERAD